MHGVTAVILGGGRGTRLFPLTLARAKPAVSFAGKYRLIDIPISNCINSNIKRVFVLTQFLSASMHRHIMQTYQFDTFTDGFVDILAAEQTPQSEDWFLGTADAVRATLNHTMYYRSNDVLILSGDHLYRMDYSELVRAHRESNADVTLCVYPVPREEAPRMGLVKTDETGVIEKFLEKPDDPSQLDEYRAPPRLFEGRGNKRPLLGEHFVASMGVYVFKPNVLLDVLQDRSHTDFGKDILPAAVGKLRLMAFPFSGYWRDIGTISALFDANIELAQPNPPFSLYQPLWPIYTRTRSLPPSRIIRSDIRDSLIVEGSDISGASITDSIVGVRSVIRENTRLKDVVINGADFYEGEQTHFGGEPPRKGVPGLGIGKHCVIERAIIDKDARIGDGVIIWAKPDAEDFRGDNYWIKDGITIVPKGAIIPPGTQI